MKRKFAYLGSIGLIASMVIFSWMGLAFGVSGTSSIIIHPYIPTIPTTVNLIPAAPSDLKCVTFPGALPVSLVWQDNSNNETGFIIERRSSGSDFNKVGEVKADVTTYTDNNVSRGMLYTYVVYAENAAGNSSNSNQMDWLTVPNPPSNLSGSLDDIDKFINLQWTGNNKYASYRIEKTVTTENGSPASGGGAIDLGPGIQEYTDQDVQAGNIYSYYVEALSWNGSNSLTGISDASNTVAVDYMNPPSNLAANYWGPTKQLKLTWQSNSPNAQWFVVDKCYNGHDPIYSFDVPANSSEFVDAVMPEHIYMFRVKAVGSNGQYSPYSGNCTWYAPPAVPDGTACETVSSSEIKLTWRDESNYETGYKISRCEGSTAWMNVNNAPNLVWTDFEVGANTTSYDDKGLKPGIYYYYRIKAVNDNNQLDSDYCPAFDSMTDAASNSPGNIIIPPGGLNKNLNLETVLQIGSPSMTVNGVSKEIDPGQGTAPVIVEGRTLLPIGAVVAAYGGTLAWDGTEGKVTVVCNKKTIELWINSLNARVDGANKTIDVAPRIINGRTMLPLSFISDNLGLKVNWDQDKQQVTIKAGS